MNRPLIAVLLPTIAAGQAPARRSAPLLDVHYDVTVDSITVGRRDIDVDMRFRVGSEAPIILSLPAWSPGHYTLLWFARRVSHFAPDANGRPLTWQLVDFQTWRMTGAQPGQSVHVRFSYLADTIDRAVAWTKPDFAFFNGTNLFLYPVGRGLGWPATVTIHTSPSWRIATGLEASSEPRTFRASNYHDLVDAPFFVGHFDFDSTAFGTHEMRYATYPAGLAGPSRIARDLSWIARLARAESAIFGVTPWRSYTVMEVVDAHPNEGGLEHHNSQLDEIPPAALDVPYVPWDYAHEMFHSWNVKRLRPADLTPYRYDRAQPTPWLWVSEGITDYYSDLAILRSGIGDSTGLLDGIAGYLSAVGSLPPAAMTDMSLQTWIGPTDGTAYMYYQKGALAGLLLDILIRDASNDRHSLDDVMRSVYQRTYAQGRGFTADDWWGAVSQAADGRSFAAVRRRFIEGRDPFPWDSILPLAGLRLVTDTVRDVELGFTWSLDSLGFRVLDVVPGGPAERSGIANNDVLVSIGDVHFASFTTVAALRDSLRLHLSASDHATYQVWRSGQRATGQFSVELTRPHPRPQVLIEPHASAKARRIRHALFAGLTES